MLPSALNHMTCPAMLMAQMLGSMDVHCRNDLDRSIFEGDSFRPYQEISNFCKFIADKRGA